MKLIDAKFAQPIHVAGKETIYANPKEVVCELKYREDLKMTVVEIRTLRPVVVLSQDTWPVTWTTFANIVYCRPMIEDEKESKLEPATAKKRHGTSQGADSASPS